MGFNVSALKVVFIVYSCLVGIYCCILFGRVLILFFLTEITKDLPLSVKSSALVSIGCLAMNSILYIGSYAYFYQADYDDRLPLPLVYAITVIVALGLLSMNSLFITRLSTSFKNTFYELSSTELKVLYASMFVTLLTATSGLLTWERDLPANHPRRHAAAVLLLSAGVAHISIACRLVHVFVSRLKHLLIKSSPSLKVMSAGGKSISAKRHLKKVMTVTNDEKTETVVRDTISVSEFEDKTMIVVMVRYTLLKIVSVLSSFITLLVVCCILLQSVNGRVHEAEIAITIMCLDTCIQMTCLFFAFLTFEFSVFRYDKFCGRGERFMMQLFENALKNDLYDSFLKEAKTAVNRHTSALIRHKTVKRLAFGKGIAKDDVGSQTQSSVDVTSGPIAPALL